MGRPKRSDLDAKYDALPGETEQQYLDRLADIANQAKAKREANARTLSTKERGDRELSTEQEHRRRCRELRNRHLERKEYAARQRAMMRGYDAACHSEKIGKLESKIVNDESDKDNFLPQCSEISPVSTDLVRLEEIGGSGIPQPTETIQHSWKDKKPKSPRNHSTKTYYHVGHTEVSKHAPRQDFSETIRGCKQAESQWWGGGIFRTFTNHGEVEAVSGEESPGGLEIQSPRLFYHLQPTSTHRASSSCKPKKGFRIRITDPDPDQIAIHTAYPYIARARVCGRDRQPVQLSWSDVWHLFGPERAVCLPDGALSVQRSGYVPTDVRLEELSTRDAIASHGKAIVTQELTSQGQALYVLALAIVDAVANRYGQPLAKVQWTSDVLPTCQMAIDRCARDCGKDLSCPQVLALLYRRAISELYTSLDPRSADAIRRVAWAISEQPSATIDVLEVSVSCASFDTYLRGFDATGCCLKHVEQEADRG